jgi:serine/threonine protein kinase
MARSGLLKYHIIGTLWVGQSSIVYRATNIRNELVAIKMLLPDTASSRRAQRMMEREARLALKLDHPNIVQAIEYIRDAPMPALVMDYFSSENLKTHIVRSQDFIHEHAKGIVLQVCDALNYVHGHGLIHLDMKPENVLVADDGLTKMIDFALAEETGRSLAQLLTRRRIAGTRPYIAPETIRRVKPDVRTDIYSLGITIYEMLTGRPPFVSEDRDSLLRMHLKQQAPFMRMYNPNVSMKMDQFVLEMLAKKREHRPENMEEVIRRMKRIEVFDK